MPPLTARLCRRIERDFPERGRSAEVMRLVSGWSPDGWKVDIERVQAAIVLLAGGRIDGLLAAMEDARTDWRDVLVAADLAQADWPDRIAEQFP